MRRFVLPPLPTTAKPCRGPRFVIGKKVAKVNTMSVKGKQKRMGRYVGYRPDRKKAIVTLEGDKTIEFFDGMY